MASTSFHRQGYLNRADARVRFIVGAVRSHLSLCQLSGVLLLFFVFSCLLFSQIAYAHSLHFDTVMSVPLLQRAITILLITSNFVPGILSHNYVECTNAKPNLTALLTEPLVAYDSSHDHCDGYPRGVPDANSFQGSQSSITGQSFPWYECSKTLKLQY